MKQLWVHKYAPKNLDSVIFSSEHEKQVFKKYSETLPNLLLIGKPGTGKSSTSNAILKDAGILPEDVLRINCSDKKIDAIRNEVQSFAYSLPMGDFKVVQLEEMDYLSMEAQALLRSTIEDVSNTCRFICTANYSNLILEPIRSRLEEVIFSAPQYEDILVRTAEILEIENISYDVQDLEMLVKTYYPDMRKILVVLENSSVTGKLVLRQSNEIKDWRFDLAPLIKNKDVTAIRKLICTSSTKESLQDIYKFLFANVESFFPKVNEAIVTIARYQYQHSFVADPEIQVAALLIELLYQ